jgi:hypothetical protein
MSLNNLLLRAVHKNVHKIKMIRPYSNPKIYTGGVAISTWSELTKAQQQDALSKEWYLYYLFRSPKTAKLVRQPNIKAGVNRYRTKRERLSFLRVLQESLLEMLEAGFDSYKDNAALENSFI